MRPLLLLVDLQRDYLAAPGLDPSAGAIVRRARDLLDRCRARGVAVAHAWTTVSRADDNRMPHWRREGRWLCEEGTQGHAPPPGLEPAAGEAVIHKTFFSPFAGGELDHQLRAQGIDLLLVCGVHLHGCVREAVLGAYERGLEVRVAEDAVGSDDPVHAAITRRYLEQRAARFVTVDEALAGLTPTAPAARATAIDETVAKRAAACRAALAPWSARPPQARLGVLTRLAEALEAEAAALTELMAAQIGKPVRYGSLEVRRTAEMLRAVARRALAPATEPAGGAELYDRPLGVVAVITPWNNPVYIPLGKIAPAIAYGNAVLWKPAPAAHAIAARIASLLARSGLPPSVLGLVAGGRQAGEAAMADPAVDAVSITGSSQAGFSAQEVCARRRIPLQAELGGNNAALVWADADLQLAANELAEGAFALAGQRCTANRRLVVHRSGADELLALLRARTAALAWGDPRDPGVTVGPIVGEPARDRIAAVVARAAEHGALVEVPHGAAEPPENGLRAAWYPPTVVRCDDPSQEIIQYETFGPVLVVQAASDWDEAMALVAGVPQGLAAAVFTSSTDLAERFEREAPAGIVKLNRSTADADVDVPFGGWKASGIGPPEHGSFDRAFYTRPQAVYH
jgi:alpha-ketoglutaric semialdehyde dehydrogenase